MKTKSIIKLLSIFILLSFAFSKSNINDYWLDFILKNFKEYTSKIPQQKLYLHLDKDLYYSGNTIWYKTYLLNSAQKQADTISKNIYVEIIAPNNSVFMNQMLKNESGFANGDFPISDTVQTGIYKIRAYTSNMKNYGKEFLFSKNIAIINKENKLFYNKLFHKKAKKIKKTKEQIDLQFFPEGGYLIENIETNLAFKAINQFGKGVDVSGEIFSKSGNKISVFKSEHLGMGKIKFKAEKEQEYYAVINSPSGFKEKYKLPKQIKTGYNLNIRNEKNKLKINIKTNQIFSNDINAKKIFLIAQNGGQIYYKEQHVFENNMIDFEIDKSIFPSGILHFTLFNSKAKPFAERLVFINKKDFLNIETNQLNKTYNTRDSINLNFKVTDFRGKISESNLSVSVRKKSNFSEIENKTNIINYFLLQSDLKGNIENPDFYFSNDENTTQALDILMLTQAWCKFNWQEILNDSITNPKFKIEKDIELKGRITKYLFNIPSKDASVELTFLNKYNDILKTYTNEKGQFEFHFSYYTDTLDILLEARSRVDKKNVLILIDDNYDLASNFYPFYGFYLDSLFEKHKIPIAAKKQEEIDPNKPKEMKLHNNPDQVIKFTDSDYIRNNSVLNELRSRVPGFDGSTMRGQSSIYGNNQPLYLIDGTPTDASAISTLSISDVESIDILK
ncbi:MAG: hypothetical protein JXR51_06470, partial [Bacteroidales bacterium]|nr:hypothetical protein [Bacteroidales bacterium]